MTLRSSRDLQSDGFVGFVTVAALVGSRCREVPVAGGVYVVLRTSARVPRFRRQSPAGWFKGVDPTVSLSALRAKWVEGTEVMYIGKATSLRSRVRQLVDYGSGRPVGHQGGRYLWQVQGSGAFLVAWKPAADPRKVETTLLADFTSEHGALPFANLSF